MFLDSTNYLSTLKNLVSEATSVDMAVAFWGNGSEMLFQNPLKITRVICNLTSGGTNPDVIEKIQNMGIEVKHLPELHAKVVLGDKLAILGSANCSTNGLNLEGEEVNGWQEAGYVVNSESDISKIRDWFSQRWSSADAVTPELLERARKIWRPRRAKRVASATGALLSMSPASLEGRNIVVAIYRDEPSFEAKKTFDEKKRSEDNDALTRSWTFYEDWPVNELKKGMTVIDIYIGAKGGVAVDGPYEIFAVKKLRRNEEPSKGKMMILHYANSASELIGISPKDALEGIKKRVQEKAFELLPKGSEAKVIPIEKFVTLI